MRERSSEIEIRDGLGTKRASGEVPAHLAVAGDAPARMPEPAHFIGGRIPRRVLSRGMAGRSRAGARGSRPGRAEMIGEPLPHTIASVLIRVPEPRARDSEGHEIDRVAPARALVTAPSS
jgi:hypothetical protein